MTSPTSPCPKCATHPAPTIAERQLELITELAEMTIVVSRAYAHAAVAAAAAAEAVVADEYYQPETERARALAGAKDAADGFQKVSRSLRLTLMLQTVIAETVRAPRPGVVRASLETATRSNVLISERNDGDSEGAFATLENALPERERSEFDRPDRPYPNGFQATVNGVVADIGATVDWATMTLRPNPLDYKPFVQKPPGHETAPPPPEYVARKAKRLMVRSERPPPRPNSSD